MFNEVGIPAGCPSKLTVSPSDLRASHSILGVNKWSPHLSRLPSVSAQSRTGHKSRAWTVGEA